MLAVESSGVNSSFQELVCEVVGYGPNEGDGEEKDRFWKEMDRIVDRVRNGYRLCILGDLNGWLGNRKRAGITGDFEVP